MDVDDIVAGALDILRSAPYVVVCSVGDDGEVHARQVLLLSITDDLGMWFGTSPQSRKVADLERTGRATVIAESFEEHAYTALTASAAIVTDTDERVRRWVDMLAPYFPDGPTGDDFVLVRLDADRIEVMSLAAGIHPEPFGLVAAVAVRTDEGWKRVPARRG